MGIRFLRSIISMSLAAILAFSSVDVYAYAKKTVPEYGEDETSVTAAEDSVGICETGEETFKNASDELHTSIPDEPSLEDTIVTPLDGKKISIEDTDVKGVYITDSADSVDEVDVINIHVGEAVRVSAVLKTKKGIMRADFAQLEDRGRITWKAEYDPQEHKYLLAPITSEYNTNEPECNIWLVGNEVTSEPVEITMGYGTALGMYSNDLNDTGIGKTPVLNMHEKCSFKVNVIPAVDGEVYTKVPEGKSESYIAKNVNEAAAAFADIAKNNTKARVWMEESLERTVDYAYLTDWLMSNADVFDGENPHLEYLLEACDDDSVLPRVGSIFRFDTRYNACEYRASSAITAEMMNMSDEKVKEMVSPSGVFGSVLNSDRKTKALAIGNWIKKNVKSKSSISDVLHSSYGALFEGKATCEGKCCLYYRLCSAMGIPCKVVTSFSKSMHTFCMIELDDGYWYYVNISNNPKLMDYKQYKHAPECYVFQTSEFLYKCTSKLKNLTKDKKKGITLIENGKTVLQTDIILNVYNYLARKADKENEYQIVLNKNLKLRAAENSVFFFPGYNITLDLNSKTLSFENSAFAAEFALKEVKNGTIKMGKDEAKKFLDIPELSNDRNGISFYGYDAEYGDKEFYANNIELNYSDDSDNTVIKNVKIKASDDESYVLIGNHVTVDSSTVIDSRFEVFK